MLHMKKVGNGDHPSFTHTASAGVRLALQVTTLLEGDAARAAKFVARVNQVLMERSASTSFEDVEDISTALSEGTLDPALVEPILAECDDDFASVKGQEAEEAFTKEKEAETKEHELQDVGALLAELRESLQFHGPSALEKMHKVLDPKSKKEFDEKNAVATVEAGLKRHEEDKRLRKKLWQTLSDLFAQVTVRDKEIHDAKRLMHELAKPPFGQADEALESVEAALGRKLDSFSKILRVFEQHLFKAASSAGVKMGFAFALEFVSKSRVGRIVELTEHIAQERGPEFLEKLFNKLKIEEEINEVIEQFKGRVQVDFVRERLGDNKLSPENATSSFLNLEHSLNKLMQERINAKVGKKLFLPNGQVDGPQFVKAKRAFASYCALQKLHIRTLKCLTELEKDQQSALWQGSVSKAIVELCDKWELKPESSDLELFKSTDIARALAKFKGLVREKSVALINLERAADFLESLVLNRAEESHMRAQEIGRLMDMGRCLRMSPSEVARNLYAMQLKPDLTFISPGKQLELIASAPASATKAVSIIAKHLAGALMMSPKPYHTDCQLAKGSFAPYLRGPLARVGFHTLGPAFEEVIAVKVGECIITDLYEFDTAKVGSWEVEIESGQAFLVAKTLQKETMLDNTQSPIKVALTKGVEDQAVEAESHRLEPYVVSEVAPFDPMRIASSWQTVVILDNALVPVYDADGKVLKLTSDSKPIQVPRLEMHRGALSQAKTVYIHLPNVDQIAATLKVLGNSDLTDVAGFVWAHLDHPDFDMPDVRSIDTCARAPMDEMYRLGNLWQKMPELNTWVAPSLACKMSHGMWFQGLRRLEDLSQLSITLILDDFGAEQISSFEEALKKLIYLRIKLILPEDLMAPEAFVKAHARILDLLQVIVKAKLKKLAVDLPMLSDESWELLSSQLSWGDLEVSCKQLNYSAKARVPQKGVPAEPGQPQISYQALTLNPVPIGFSKVPTPLSLPAIINWTIEAEPLSKQLLDPWLAQGTTRALSLRSCGLRFQTDLMRWLLDFCSFKGQTTGLYQELAAASGVFTAADLRQKQAEIAGKRVPLQQLWQHLTEELEERGLKFTLDLRSADVELVSLARAALELMSPKKAKKKKKSEVSSLSESAPAFVLKLGDLLERRYSSLRRLDLGCNELGQPPIRVFEEISLEDEGEGYLDVTEKEETQSLQSFAPSVASSVAEDRLREIATRREVMAKSPEGFLIGRCVEAWTQLVHLGVDSVGGNPWDVIDACTILLTTSLVGGIAKDEEVIYSLRSLKIGSDQWTFEEVERLTQVLDHTLIDSLEVPHSSLEVQELVRTWNIERGKKAQKETQAHWQGSAKNLVKRFGTSNVVKV